MGTQVLYCSGARTAAKKNGEWCGRQGQRNKYGREMAEDCSRGGSEAGGGRGLLKKLAVLSFPSKEERAHTRQLLY
jgi:hypothetical protein